MGPFELIHSFQWKSNTGREKRSMAGSLEILDMGEAGVRLGRYKRRSRSGSDVLRSELSSCRDDMLHLLTTLAFAGAAAATYGKNLNYRSPSWNHPSLGISIHKVNKRNAGASPYGASSLNFTHGVASGDPYPESVILWTRCAPTFDDVNDNSTVSGTVPVYNPVPIYSDGNGTTVSKAPICVSFKIATDKDLTDVVDSGDAYTSSDVDYTLKVV